VKCLIIAAGKGHRLQSKGDSKPLVPLFGIPLIERVIRCALKAGADDFFVVTGYQGEGVRVFLDRLAERLGIGITPIVNEDWEKENGLSVLKARDFLSEPFLLLMADHLFDPSIVCNLFAQPLAKGGMVLGVDTNMTNPLIDLEDVTRVRTEGGKIRDIGKNLKDYNGFDTGLFVCDPAIFDALDRCVEATGDISFSGAVRELAGNGLANAMDINGQFWVDVDDPNAFRRAENALLSHMRGKVNDGPVARFLNRPLSIWVSRRLINYSITPNQISLVSFLFSMLAAGLLALGDYFSLFMGGVLAQFASVIDGCDGEVARLKFQASDYGKWLDAVLDRYADAFLLFGLTWHAYGDRTEGLVLFVGFMAIIGSFLLSYTADKYDLLMSRQIRQGKGLRMGRDIRVFIIFLGAVLHIPFWSLLLIAVMMNLETIRRIIVCRNYE